MDHQPFVQGMELGEVLKQYNWEPLLVQNVGGIWRITCREGVYALKKSKAPREKLLLLHRILDGIRAKGFSHLLPWVPTSQGEPVALEQSGVWYATPWKTTHGFPDQEKVPAVNELAKSLACLHRLAESLVKPYPDLCTTISDDFLNGWKQKQEKLSEVTEQIQSREFQSPFDKCFSANQENIEHSLSFSIRGMERIKENEDGKFPRYTLCHKRIHPSNLVQEVDHYYIIDFDHAQVDSPVRDLATLMKRSTAFANHPEKPLEILEAYESEWKLQPKEKKLLALYLSYPERLIKTVNQYYEENKIAQEEAQAVKRLEAELHQHHLLQEIVKSLWTNKKARPDDKRQNSVVSVSRRSGKKKGGS
ncbi:phosphotransferase [Paenactinomyces guangxiensis]|uniref:Phosphotransferase n=1 Tax=Paenactinomyces guangxiensis TaxID=1490290 RepID=A0A7W1WUC4_9BACL|nr:phosphotransferase [Paenactinomyces guangxiensis]MBA4496138.1 phosphotransferase [Paenactinomyces guangxiensis]MBH8593226.1 phosphotransferase [Paenactinomyces guangxiensis]